jgi:hypothetical protein
LFGLIDGLLGEIIAQYIAGIGGVHAGDAGFR